MEFVRPWYDYSSWMQIVRYKKSMCRYALTKNYIQQKFSEKIKIVVIYIDGRSKASGNIVGFINSLQLALTKKPSNCIFEACEGNCVFVCVIKSIDGGKELPIDYNLNNIDTRQIQ